MVLFLYRLGIPIPNAVEVSAQKSEFRFSLINLSLIKTEIASFQFNV